MIDCKRQNKRILINLFDNFIIIEEEEEDTVIYQLWAHEGHEYSHI
jgi:hypothetical protein